MSYKMMHERTREYQENNVSSFNRTGENVQNSGYVKFGMAMKLLFFFWNILFFYQIVQTGGAIPTRFDAIDSQCPREFYYQWSQCYACGRCSVDEIPNEVISGCRNFPYLCATENVDEPKANKFHPHNWPQLLGSFSENTSAWLVFFFHEDGQPIIGKICMKESQYSQHDWRSYQKAFLQPNSSSDGIKYTHLEAVQLYDFSLPPNMSMYFAIFSNAGSEMAKSSAVCMIESKDIREVFYSQKFRNETTGAVIEKRELPWPLGTASGRCGFISEDSEWLQDHPLMSDQVDCTATFEYEGRFLALETLEKLGPDGVLHKVIFIGTEDGRLLKFTLDGESFTFLMEEYFTNDSTIGITNLKVNFMYDERILNVSTSDGLHHQLGLQNCNKISNQCICEQDPFCIWSINRVECIEFFKDYDSQPVSKKQCEGVNQHDALLVVDEYNRRKPEIPTTTITTVDVTKAKTTVKPTKDAAKKEESTSTDNTTMWVLIIFVPIAALCVFALLYCLSKRGRYRRVSSREDLRWKSGWTTIRVLEDCGNKIIRDDKGNEHVGVVNNRGWFLCRRNVVTVFSDLSPSTQYCLGTHLMETGPTFSNHKIELDTYKVDIAWEGTKPCAYIVLQNSEKNIKKEKPIHGHSFSMSPLPPNMEFKVYLEVQRSSTDSTRTSKYICTVSSPAVNFHVTCEDRIPFLSWENLSPAMSHLQLRCCNCVQTEDWSEDHPSMNGSKELPCLPWGVKCPLKVTGSFNGSIGMESDHIIATLDHETIELDDMSCSANLDVFLKLSVKEKDDVVIAMVPCKDAVKVLCGLLHYSDSDIDVILSRSNYRKERVIEIFDKVELHTITLLTFLRELQRLIKAMKPSSGSRNDDTKNLLRLIETLVKNIHPHEKCSNCSEVVRSSNHLVNC
ncbi:uncharacterized protein [Apostichopus japonicus]|uniref:uncharacterized protein isoform X2 n=1 Tax=Stichopus japonicus TaxID=307972 RepID=UPI003AB72A68